MDLKEWLYKVQRAIGEAFTSKQTSQHDTQRLGVYSSFLDREFMGCEENTGHAPIHSLFQWLLCVEERFG
jgi:hypothetical protein